MAYDWQEITTRRRHLLSEYAITKAEVDVGITLHVVLPAPGGLTSVWVGKEQLRTLGKKIAKLSNAKKTLDKSFTICENLVKTCKKIGAATLKSATNKELLTFAQKYDEAQYEHGYTMIYPHAIEQILVDEVKGELAILLKKIKKEAAMNQYVEKLFIPSHETFAAKEHRELLELVEWAKQKGLRIDNPKVVEKLKAHTKKYSWQPVYNPDESERDLNFFTTALTNLLKEDSKKELDKLKQTKLNQKAAFESAIKELAPKKIFLILLKTLQNYIYLRTYRTDVLRQAYVFIKPFFAETAKRAKLTFNEVINLTPPELERFYESGTLPERSELQQRVKHFAIWTDGQDIEIFSNPEEIENLRKKAFPEQEEAKELVGRPASPGKAKGPVVLIFNTEDMYKVKPGDIIVAPMTSPDLTIVIKIAGAIVTDEGGVTCHAAIISRELQIPCVVGTKHATRVLKDGDIVTVDAYRGVVKKI